MCVHVVEGRPNVRGLAAFGIGGQLVHQLSDDASFQSRQKIMWWEG